MIYRYRGQVENGKLQLYETATFNMNLGLLEGKRIELTVKEYKKSRTIPQNSLYWFYLNFIGKEIGEVPEDLHSTFKAMFLVDRKTKIPIVRSTTTLNTEEFSEYIERIAQRVASIGIVLPDPNIIDLNL